MLVLTRRKGESIVVDDCIEIAVISVEGDTIKLGIEAPKSISIYRKEIYLQIQKENEQAAKVDIDLNDMKNQSWINKGKQI
ncbi:carbon storage regulator CsrA [Bacillus horti]|uniref:Translational regulator CsrA n=1 Tax=Caldalkalibacillus horti TaxID=77523 RepID=A0ABT9VZP0_9BACI|nr:carbon storage regulator CsrA [Bacillus horti]MDQ0166339.1 carbon storage regulator [Bacillus horti]